MTIGELERQSVWDSLVGQQRSIHALSNAASGQGMTHAWLFTGPPGSGRSNAAIAFAAALQCERSDGGEPGCGACHACHTVLVGTHADVSVVRTEQLSIGVKEVRELVRRAALAPVGPAWQIVVIEDADRLTDQASNALLKAIEEPSERTVWLLCTPTSEDMLPTIRSRCRVVDLSTPHDTEVAQFLTSRLGVPADLAQQAARAAQGHIGRAKALATDADTMARRREIVSIPHRLAGLADALRSATSLHTAATEEARALTDAADEREKKALDAAYGVVERGRRPREYGPALAALEKEQKTRAKRKILDVIDRGLMDLASVYRDAIRLSAAPDAALVNVEHHTQLMTLAEQVAPEVNLRRIDLIFAAREQMLEFNVPALLACESLMIGLWLAGAEETR